MGRRFADPRLVLASHNAGKIIELRDLLQPHGVTVVSNGELGLPEPVEDGLSFTANAELKARAAAFASGLPALADDSGLAVTGLGGDPGIYSARWAGPERDFGRAMAEVRDALAEKFGSFASADRSAAFIAVLCLAWPDGHVEFAEGRVEGTLVDPPRGDGGFGYDPMFVPVDHDRTFGEMAAGKKQALSHRARAFASLLECCFTDG